MKFYLETDRLILRELQLADIYGMYAMNADAKVQNFVGNKPITNLADAGAKIDFIIEQYKSNGIGRWAVIEKETNHFVGWSGLKLITKEMNGHNNFYELGYRFIPKYWGKGFATETAKVAIDYGFNMLNLNSIYAITDCRNNASIRVLQKVGFTLVEKFEHQHVSHYWLLLKSR